MSRRTVLMSCRAVRHAETLPSLLRLMRSIACASVHPSRTAATQRLLIDINSRRDVGYTKAHPISSLYKPQNAGEEIMKTNQQSKLQIDDNDLVYEAPMIRAVRIMKAVSVTSCTLTSIGMPVLCVLSAQDTSTIGKWAMCGTIMLFGLGTTSLFHYLFKPYVMRMWLANASHALASAGVNEIYDSTVTVETLTLFAQVQRHSFRLSDVSPPTQVMHPMVSFQACGRHYFIHPETFGDQKLLKMLIGSRKDKGSE